MSVFEKIVATIFGGLLLAILSYWGTKLWRWLQKDTATILLHLSDIPKSPEIKLVLRHVRDGKDEVQDARELQNEDQPFRKRWFRNIWVSTIGYSSNVGFQFRCYIEFPSHLEREVFKFIGDSGFIEPTNDETIQGRVWFLIPDVARCLTQDNPPYTNNYYHPRTKSIVHRA